MILIPPNCASGTDNTNASSFTDLSRRPIGKLLCVAEIYMLGVRALPIHEYLVVSSLYASVRLVIHIHGDARPPRANRPIQLESLVMSRFEFSAQQRPQHRWGQNLAVCVGLVGRLAVTAKSQKKRQSRFTVDRTAQPEQSLLSCRICPLGTDCGSLPIRSDSSLRSP
ncbi:hypothetical protein BJV78DRAFT_591133 [Lactifluus subvellereus]|nr:hypothetical protein BJV78DRAFT_591133 [Lactifluus subvellereus]